MSKVFACVFPFFKKSQQESWKNDVQNTAFINGSSSSSLCELSYHHVDSVSKKCLQKRIQKLERERETLVEMMIYQHESFKKSTVLQKSEKKMNIIKNKDKSNTTENYYKKIQNKSKKQRTRFEESFSENVYDYITFE